MIPPLDTPSKMNDVIGADECPTCGGTTTLIRERVDFDIGKRRTTVPIERMRCRDCGESYYTPDQLDAAQRAASDEIRRQDGLLKGEEIRSIRENTLGLTQAEFEQLLGVGPKTVIRWEKGTVFQNRATDLLIRLVGALPAAGALLSEWNKVSVPVKATAPDFEGQGGERYVSFSVVEMPRQTARKGRKEAKVIPIGSKLRTADQNIGRVTLADPRQPEPLPQLDDVMEAFE